MKSAKDLLWPSDVLPYDDQYWTDNSNELSVLIEQTSARIAIEVGCWTGHTTMYLAHHVPMVIAVDAWAPYTDGISILPMPIEQAYRQFLSNIRHVGVGDKVFVMRESSLAAARDIQDHIADIIFIDAAHDEISVYNDLKAWFHKLIPHHGILCGDDWFIPGVRKAIERFADDRHLTINLFYGPKDHGEKTLSHTHRYDQTFWYLT